MQNAIAITFDIDWAPDWAIALCDGLCRRAGTKVTYFITHESDILVDLKKATDRIELGIHPNFLPGSSHGDAIGQVLATCLKMVPDAMAMRTHSLVQSTRILGEVADRTRIDVDVSLLLPFHAGLQPTDFYAGASRRRLVRLPYFWEDDIAADWPNWLWTKAPISTEGLAIYNFHPIFIALNIDSMDQYEALKHFLGGRFLGELTEAECAPFTNRGVGARDFLERLLQSAPTNSFQTVSAIAQNYRQSKL